MFVVETDGTPIIVYFDIQTYKCQYHSRSSELPLLQSEISWNVFLKHSLSLCATVRLWIKVFANLCVLVMSVFFYVLYPFSLMIIKKVCFAKIVGGSDLIEIRINCLIIWCPSWKQHLFRSISYSLCSHNCGKVIDHCCLLFFAHLVSWIVTRIQNGEGKDEHCDKLIVSNFVIFSYNFLVKKSKTWHCPNLFPNRKLHLLFILNQFKADRWKSNFQTYWQHIRNANYK